MGNPATTRQEVSRARHWRSGVAVTPGDRARARLPAHRAKVARALALVEEAAAIGTIAVGYSGGKDSTVLLDLVRRVVPDVLVYWTDSGCEYRWTGPLAEKVGATRIPLAADFMAELKAGGYWGHDGPTTDRARYGRSVGYWDEMTTYEPARRFRAEHPHDVTALGLRRDESAARRIRLRTSGQLYYAEYRQCWHLCPLAWWRVDDVWAYIADRGLPYNHAYDRMTEIGVPRHLQRVSILLGVAAAATGGRYTTLREIDPERWNELVADFPSIANYT